jgi:hypothetical protein
VSSAAHEEKVKMVQTLASNIQSTVCASKQNASCQAVSALVTSYHQGIKQLDFSKMISTQSMEYQSLNTLTTEFLTAIKSNVISAQ